MEAFTLCRKVLSQLGEDIPESLQPDQIIEIVVATLQIVNRISDKDLLEMKEMDERLSISMHFYSLMATAGFFRKPEMSPFIACRMVEYTMEKGLCKYSILGFVQFASVLLSSKIGDKKGIKIASQIGKAAMSCSKTRYHTSDILPNLYMGYYGFIAPYTEPLQTCADMLRQGFDAGMSLGESGMAFFNALTHIRTAVHSGDRLPTLLEKVDYYLALANTFQNEIAKAYLSIYRGTISTLMDKGASTRSSPLAIDVSTDTANAKFLEATYFQGAIQAYWQGYSERCQYYIGKFLLCMTSDTWRFQFFTNSVIIVFIHGMNSFQLMKCKSSTRMLAISKKAIRKLKTAASLSSWNFSNKVRYDELMLIFLFSFSLVIFLNSSSLCCNTYPLGSFVRS